jgi:hypothetical protein
VNGGGAFCEREVYCRVVWIEGRRLRVGDSAMMTLFVKETLPVGLIGSGRDRGCGTKGARHAMKGDFRGKRQWRRRPRFRRGGREAREQRRGSRRWVDLVEHRALMGGRSARKHTRRAITFERCQLSGLDLARFCPEKSQKKYESGSRMRGNVLYVYVNKILRRGERP